MAEGLPGGMAPNVPTIPTPEIIDPLRGLPVLVVDDEDTLRDLGQRIFERSGSIVTTATNGKDAMARISEQLPGLIFTDLGMPEMSGQELIAWLKSNPETSSIPVILSSGGGKFADSQEATDESGANAFLHKPFDIRQVLSTARQLVSERATEEAQPI